MTAKKNPKKKPTTINSLEERVNTLEGFIIRMAHQNGTANFLKDFGLEKWEPGKKDMSRYGG